MEQPCKIRIVLLLLASVFVSNMRIHAAIVPDDVLTIEALVDVHKRMKKAEDLAVLELTTIEETHSLTERATTAVNKTRTVLNKRLSDANSYISLALQLTNVTLKVKNLIENYADFTKYTYQHALSQPLTLAYYTNANIKIKREVELIGKMVAGFSAAGINLLKATMQEKYMVLGQIDNAVLKINMIINHANLVCRGMQKTGIRMYHVKELLSDKTNKEITDKLIALWIQNQAKQ